MLGGTNPPNGVGNSLSAQKPIIGFSPKNSQLNLASDTKNQDHTNLVGPTLLAGRKVGIPDSKQVPGNSHSAGVSKKDLAVSGLVTGSTTNTGVKVGFNLNASQNRYQ
jgi:hypothetical protein